MYTALYIIQMFVPIVIIQWQHALFRVCCYVCVNKTTSLTPQIIRTHPLGSLYLIMECMLSIKKVSAGIWKHATILHSAITNILDGFAHFI